MNLFRIVRNQNIYTTDDNINSDGLYFLGSREKNMFKSQVTIKNTGTIALRDYPAKLWLRVPEGKELYPNESVVEGNIGLHLTDWSIFDKLVCGVALIDLEGNVLFGKVPSVDECKSYNEKTLITPQYAWSY